MCTATWLHRDERFRLYFNRDELRSRGPARPPRRGAREGTRMIAPIDSDAGGSWIGVNERGLVAFLLNGYVEETAAAPPADPPAGGWATRGELVLEALAAPDLDDATARIEALDAQRYRTFLLGVLAPDGSGVLARWLDGTLRIGALDPARMPLSSSSVETASVIARRRERWARERPPADAALDEAHAAHLAYHASVEPDSGAHSVCMARPDACTRSFTWIDVGSERVTLHYLDAPPCRAESTELQSVALDRRGD